jgi:hypothetical protein
MAKRLIALFGVLTLITSSAMGQPPHTSTFHSTLAGCWEGKTAKNPIHFRTSEAPTRCYHPNGIHLRKKHYQSDHVRLCVAQTDDHFEVRLMDMYHKHQRDFTFLPIVTQASENEVDVVAVVTPITSARARKVLQEDLVLNPISQEVQASLTLNPNGRVHMLVRMETHIGDCRTDTIVTNATLYRKP